MNFTTALLKKAMSPLLLQAHYPEQQKARIRRHFPVRAQTRRVEGMRPAGNGKYPFLLFAGNPVHFPLDSSVFFYHNLWCRKFGFPK
jgi:hypothetical protein